MKLRTYCVTWDWLKDGRFRPQHELVEATSAKEAKAAIKGRYIPHKTPNPFHLEARQLDSIKISYAELASAFRGWENKAVEWRTDHHRLGAIVFTEDSFKQHYDLGARTYIVSSDNKAFQPNMGGYSIYGSADDGSDPMVRLERYMAAERGGEKGWKVDYCYLLQTYYAR